MTGTNIHDGGRGRYAGGETPTNDDHLATKKYVDDQGGTVDVTDGVVTVSGLTELDFTSGATVTDAGGGVAQVAVSGGGSQPVLYTTPAKYNLAPFADSSTSIVLVPAQLGKLFVPLWASVVTSDDYTTDNPVLLIVTGDITASYVELVASKNGLVQPPTARLGVGDALSIVFLAGGALTITGSATLLCAYLSLDSVAS